MQKVKAERNGNFTVINNYHLHDKNISTGTKTLMTLLLSLPEDWVLSVKGISKILNETEYAVRKMMKELEVCRYLKKEQHKDENGKYTKMEYTIYELPYQETSEPTEDQDKHPVPYPTGSGAPQEYSEAAPPEQTGEAASVSAERPESENKPLVEIPQAGKPRVGQPLVELPRAVISPLLNTKDTNKIHNNLSIDSVRNEKERAGAGGSEETMRVLSPPEQTEAHFRQVRPTDPQQLPACGRAAMPRQEIYGQYRRLIMGNIEYDSLRISLPYDIDTVDGLVELMLEVLCSTKPCIRISGTEYPKELVKARFLKLRYDHMIYILDCLRENTSDVRNVKQYLLAVLFNAAATMEGFYTLKVGHDLAAGTEVKTS